MALLTDHDCRLRAEGSGQSSLQGVFVEVNRAIEPWRWAYLAGAGLTVLVGAYLTYSLLFVTRVPCKLCFTSHASGTVSQMNISVFAILNTVWALAI